MNIPNSFKNKIVEVFYDKNLELYSKSSELDEEGGETEGIYTKITDFKGNVKVNSNEYNLKTYGIEIDADYEVTTNQSLMLGQYFKYQSSYYKIIKLLNFDSHNVAFGVLK